MSDERKACVWCGMKHDGPELFLCPNCAELAKKQKQRVFGSIPA